LCNTPEEAGLIAHRFPNAARARIVGVGVDPVPLSKKAPWRPVPGPYLLYVGRLEAGKGLKELLELHRNLGDGGPTLVLAGSGELRTNAPNVVRVGRISEQQKYDALRQADAAVVPSRYESLSLLALEAFASGTPVIGNAESEVVSGHLERSGAGFAFSDGKGYVDAVRRVQADRKALSKKARAYARRFRWPKVVEAYLEEIERIRKA
jgi:glycosyltransferase involved in cell wall biosynthesis